MNFVEYNLIDAVNWSSLRAMRVSPLQYRYERNREREDTVSMRIGRAVHTLILEPDQYQDRHPVFSGRTRRGVAWDEFCDAHPSADIISGTEAARAEACAEAVLAHPVAQEHMKAGMAEHVVRWNDPTSGLACKARCDLVNGHLVDLKTTRDVTPRAFARQAADLAYHGQIAFYHEGCHEAGHVLDDGPPVIVAVGNEPPHDVVVYAIPLPALQAGVALRDRLLWRLAECLASNTWPGIAPEHAEALDLPPWAINEDDNPITLDGVEFPS